MSEIKIKSVKLTFKVKENGPSRGVLHLLSSEPIPFSSLQLSEVYVFNCIAVAFLLLFWRLWRYCSVVCSIVF